VTDDLVVANNAVVAVEEKQAEALATIATSLNSISRWITSGGLTQVLSGYARTQSVQGILQGLATHDGRKALDAQTMEQNALEITTQIEAVYKKYEEKLTAYMNGEPIDPNLHNAEESFSEWKKMLKERK
jgi:hypothetical protein